MLQFLSRRYGRVGFDCHSLCPANMRNDGLFCRAAEYGRGAGYPWKFGDALNDNGMIGRCESDNGRGNCEKNGLVYNAPSASPDTPLRLLYLPPESS